MSARRPSPGRSAAGNRDRARSGDDEEGKRQQDGLAGQFSGVHPSRLAVLAARMGVDKHYGSQHESQAPKRRQHGEDSRSSVPPSKRRRRQEKEVERPTEQTCDEFGRRIPSRSERRQGGDRGEKKKKRDRGDKPRPRRARDGHKKREERHHDVAQHDLEEGEIPQRGAVHDALEEGELPQRTPIQHHAHHAHPSQPAHGQLRCITHEHDKTQPLTKHDAPKQPGQLPNPTLELPMQGTAQHEMLHPQHASADPAHHTAHQPDTEHPSASDISYGVHSASTVVVPVESHAVLAPLTHDLIHQEPQPHDPEHSIRTSPQQLPADALVAAAPELHMPLRPVVSFKLRMGRRVGRAISLGEEEGEEAQGEVGAEMVREETGSGEKDAVEGALGNESENGVIRMVDGILEDADGEQSVVDGQKGDGSALDEEKAPDEQAVAAKEEDEGEGGQHDEKRKSRKRRERDSDRHGKRSHKHKRERRDKREEDRHGQEEKRSRRERRKSEKSRGGTSRGRDRDEKSRGSACRDADRDGKIRRRRHSDKDEVRRASHTRHSSADKEEHPPKGHAAAAPATTAEKTAQRGRLFQGLFRLQGAGHTASTVQAERCARTGNGNEDHEREKRRSASRDTHDKEAASCHQMGADIPTHVEPVEVDVEEIAAMEPDVEGPIHSTPADASAGPEEVVEQLTVSDASSSGVGEGQHAEQDTTPANVETTCGVEDDELAGERRDSITSVDTHREQHGQTVMPTMPDIAQPAVHVVEAGGEASRFGADWCVSPALYVSSLESGHECACEDGDEAGDIVLERSVMAERRRVREAAENGQTEQDMFGEEFDAEELQDDETIASSSMCVSAADACDDKDGFHVFRAGELIAGRYLVYSLAGKGVFSTVVRARDQQHDALSARPREVVVKVIRRNEMMYNSSMHEEKVCAVVLRQLAETDVNNRGHCVRLHEAFDYLGHRCLVFDSYAFSLRKMVTTFKGTGVSLVAVRAYGRQMLLALRLLKKCELVHADIKLDNMLTMDGRPALVMSDFGSAVHVRGDGEIAPYLVSRFYRAPEVILGIPFGYYTDMWAVACCLFELYTGTYLFPGRSNNEMLKLHMDALGCFPRKTLRTGQFMSTHFDSEFRFIYQERNENLNRNLEKRIAYSHEAARPVRDRIMAAALGTSDAGDVALEQFADLLLKMLALDPHKRIVVKGALTHPFILPV